MNSLNQYLELYRLNRQAIDAGSADPLNDKRDEAFELLSVTRLPRRGDEGYERTSVEDMFADDYGVNINRMDFPADIAASFRCEVPNMSTLLGVVVNDTFHPTGTLIDRLPQGVTFTSLRREAIDNPELIRRHYGSVADGSDPATALNTMLVQDGVVIRVGRGVRLEKPLQLVNIFRSPTSMMALRRLLVIMEEDSEAQLLVCDHTQDKNEKYLSSEVVEISLGKGASFDYCHIEESSENTVRHSQLYVRQHESSRLSVAGITLTCGNTRNSYSIDLSEPDCETLLCGMAIGSDSQSIDNNVSVRHLSHHCRSNQLFKYVLDDKSTGAFCGKILVAPGAAYTDAFQTNRNLLASTGARMHTKPQLEIYNDDVKCSHGATTGQLDADALFYMRTRGIPEAEARNMLMQAFMSDVIDVVRMEGLRDRLRHLVQRRFEGYGSATCADCRSACKNDNNQP